MKTTTGRITSPSSTLSLSADQLQATKRNTTDRLAGARNAAKRQKCVMSRIAQLSQH
jgi:hypothetical protein